MRLVLPILLLAGVVVLYFAVIRPRGAHMLKTYRENGGGWAGVKAVLWGFQTFWAAAAGSFAYALPELATAAGGVDFKEMLPEPWGAYVATALAIGIPLMRAFAATPSGQPPSPEA
jgi:hypothetical protein